MFIQILFYIFIIVSMVNVIHFGLYLIGANYYDIKRFRALAKPVKKKRGLQPLVSVLIPAHNESISIVRCLDSVRRSRYRKMEIIVVDDGSTDNTKQLVRAYMEKHSNRNIRLMYKQKNSGKAHALNHALRNGAKGSLIMTLDADSVIDKASISNTVKYFKDPAIAGVAANVRIMDNNRILGLLQIFEYIIGYRSKKFYSASRSEFIIGGVASTYRAEVIKKVSYYDTDVMTEDIALSLKIAASGNRANKLVYGVDVVAMTESVTTFKALVRQRYRWKMGMLQSLFRHRKLVGNTDGIYSKSLTFYRIPMAFFGEVLIILEPIAIAFIIYIIIKSGSAAFVIGAYMTITGYLLWNIWPDELMSTSRKIKMTLFAPLMYFIFYLMNVVQLSAMARCLFNHKQVTRKNAIVSSWVSPKRILQT